MSVCKMVVLGVLQEYREARVKPTNHYEASGEKNKLFKLEMMLELMKFNFLVALKRKTMKPMI